MKKAILAIVCAIALLGVTAVPVFAADACDYCKGDNCEIICKKGQKEADAENMVGKILQTVFGIIGVIAVIVIIIGGIMYTTSQGDSTKLSTAKNTILYAAIGLIISLLSFAIVTFIIQSMGGKAAEPETPPEESEPTSMIRMIEEGELTRIS